MDPPSDAASNSPSLDAPDPYSASASASSSPFPPPQRDTVVQTAAVLRSEEYRQLFRLPAEEVLVEDFNCAYQENILVQASVFWEMLSCKEDDSNPMASEILFAKITLIISSASDHALPSDWSITITTIINERLIATIETFCWKIIHFREISSVKRAKTAGIFPNAIEIYAGGKKYFFASFLSRDEAFNLISNGWLNHGGCSNEITEKQALTPQSSLRENGFESDGMRNSTTGDDMETSERNMDAPKCIDSVSAPNVEDSKSSTTAKNSEENVEGHDDGLLSTFPSPSTLKAWSWKVEDADASKIPEDLTKVAGSKFPITVEEFFNLFFSDNAFKFVESFHKRCGDKEFKCSPWIQHDHFGHSRNLSFQHPIKLYLGARCGSCQELQKFRVFKNSNLVIETSQEINDVPYGDYFRVEGLWDIRREANESCSLSVYIRVAFVKKTMFKGKIVQSTVEECREAYASWIDMAHNLLKETILENREDDVTPNCGTTPNGNAGSHDAGNIEPSEALPLITDSSVPKNSSSMTLNQYNGRTSLHIFFSSETTIFIQESTVKLWSKLRRQIHLPLLAAVLLIIILLMQLSIVVLLSRQQKDVRVIPQADHVSGVEDRSMEVMAWLEKRLYYLKEEVSLVEARLERMQWEYSRVKQQLRELEQVHKK